MLLDDNEDYRVVLADCIEHMHAMPRESVHMSIFSPPFPSVFSYLSSMADIGNIEDLTHDAKLHFSFFMKALRPVMKPGRVVMIHCTQVVRMKRAGGEGLYDLRGLLIRLAQRAGFIYDYDWLVRKGPQSQAIRTKSRALQFAGLEADRGQSRGANGDYLLKLITPGERETPINSAGQITRNEWIKFAECCWDDVSETDTLNTREAKSEDDTRHICALQLEVINRLVRLYSNPDEIVFSPFAGIGSELYEAVKLGRRAYGCELKPEYHRQAIKNVEKAIRARDQADSSMFDFVA